MHDWDIMFNMHNLQGEAVSFSSEILIKNPTPNSIESFTFEQLISILMYKVSTTCQSRILFGQYRQNLMDIIQNSCIKKGTKKNGVLDRQSIRNICMAYNMLIGKKIITPGKKTKKELCILLTVELTSSTECH